MTSIKIGSRQTKAASTNMSRLARAIEDVPVGDVQRAIRIKRQMQVENAVLKVELQEDHLVERKFVNEMLK